MKNIVANLRSIGSMTDGRLICAGPISKQPGTKPYRTVMHVSLDGSLCVTDECFVEEDIEILKGAIPGRPLHSYGSHGDYHASDFLKAMDKFMERLAKCVGYLPSAFREEATV